MKRKKLFIGAVLGAINFVAALAPSFAAGQSSGLGTITRLRMDESGETLRIHFSNPIVNPDNCTGEEYYMVELSLLTGDPDRFVSMVLSAHLAQREVHMWIDGCTVANHWGATRPLARDINIW